MSATRRWVGLHAADRRRDAIWIKDKRIAAIDNPRCAPSEPSPRMTFVRLLLPALAAIALAAHFHRAGNLLLSGLAVALVALLFVPRAWAARTVQLGLAAGALEWVLTLVRLIDARQALGQPYLRLAAILGAVALVTALSALVFRTGELRRRFRLD
jgi:hypothetical protein